MRYAELKHNLPSSSFPPRVELKQNPPLWQRDKPSMNTSRRRSKGGNSVTHAIEEIDMYEDEFEDELDDGDLIGAGKFERSYLQRDFC